MNGRAALFAAALIAVAAGCDFGTREPGTDAGEPFLPPTHHEGARLVMPLTFPDGTTAELVYPSRLALERSTVRPYSSGRLHGRSPTPLRGNVVGRDFFIVEGALERVLAGRNGRAARLLAEYEGSEGRRIGFWDVRWNANVHYLGFQLGRWSVLVYDYVGTGGMTDAERASWARSFTGQETDEGWLVLEADGPLRLARAGEHAGPQLTFSAGGEQGFHLTPGACRPHQNQDRVVAGKLVQWRGGVADWCLSPSMRVQAVGRRSFVGALIRGLEIRNVVLAR